MLLRLEVLLNWLLGLEVLLNWLLRLEVLLNRLLGLKIIVTGLLNGLLWNKVLLLIAEPSLLLAVLTLSASELIGTPCGQVRGGEHFEHTVSETGRSYTRRSLRSLRLRSRRRRRPRLLDSTSVLTLLRPNRSGLGRTVRVNVAASTDGGSLRRSVRVDVSTDRRCLG